MANTSLEYLLIAGNALARAEWQSSRPVTAEDVSFAVEQTAQQMVAAKLVTSAEADTLVKSVPAAWASGQKFNSRFFQELRDTSMLGVDSKALEPLVAGVSAAIQDAGAARTQKAAVDARKNVPAELLTPVSAGMDFDVLTKQLEAAFVHPAFLAELGGSGRFGSDLARAAWGVCVQPGAVRAVPFNQRGKPLSTTLFTLPNPTTVHDLALHLVAAQQAQSAVSDSGFWGAILGSKVGISAGQAPGSAWSIETSVTDAGIVVGLEVTNIDEQLGTFNNPPAHDQAMDERVAAYVAGLGKSLMDEVAKGTPLLQVRLGR